MKQESISLKKQNLMNKKNRKVCKGLNYIEESLILVSAVTGCVSISVFASLTGIPIDMTSSGLGLNICAKTAGTKKCQSIIQKKRKNHNKIVLLAKAKLNNMGVPN